jgi:hypothetical protein
MSNSKISALTGATTPLAGTEVLPIVQSSTTKQVSVANLTAGRTQTSNGIVQGTAATGYNFTANTPASGMTSQLLNWYEEGVWVPVAASTSGTITTYTATGVYTRVGRIVFLQAAISVTNIGTASGNMTVSAIPFTANRLTSSIAFESNATGYSYEFQIPSGTTSGTVLTFTNSGGLNWQNNMILNLSFAITV